MNSSTPWPCKYYLKPRLPRYARSDVYVLITNAVKQSTFYIITPRQRNSTKQPTRYKILGYKSCQSALIDSISAIFLAREPALICFSRAMALLISSHSS